jgi:hypothetical protein
MSRENCTNVTLPIAVEHLTCADPHRILSFWAEKDPKSPGLLFIGGSYPYQSLLGKMEKPETMELAFVENARAFQLGPFDPWKLRDTFLAWPPDEWQNFVVMADPFGPDTVNQEIFEQWQKLIGEAMTRPQEWKALESASSAVTKQFGLCRPLNIVFEWEGKAPRAIIRETTTLGAILAAIQLDNLGGAEFRWCARSDCKNPPFKIEARHKIYCGSDCAHVVAVRESRKRKREAEASSGRKRAVSKISRTRRTNRGIHGTQETR